MRENLLKGVLTFDVEMTTTGCQECNDLGFGRFDFPCGEVVAREAACRRRISLSACQRRRAKEMAGFARIFPGGFRVRASPSFHVEEEEQETLRLIAAAYPR